LFFIANYFKTDTTSFRCVTYYNWGWGGGWRETFCVLTVRCLVTHKLFMGWLLLYVLSITFLKSKRLCIFTIYFVPHSARFFQISWNTFLL